MNTHTITHISEHNPKYLKFNYTAVDHPTHKATIRIEIPHFTSVNTFKTKFLLNAKPLLHYQETKYP